jgi:hypothetical protein
VSEETREHQKLHEALAELRQSLLIADSFEDLRKMLRTVDHLLVQAGADAEKGRGARS